MGRQRDACSPRRSFRSRTLGFDRREYHDGTNPTNPPSFLSDESTFILSVFLCFFFVFGIFSAFPPFPLFHSFPPFSPFFSPFFSPSLYPPLSSLTLFPRSAVYFRAFLFGSSACVVVASKCARPSRNLAAFRRCCSSRDQTSQAAFLSQPASAACIGEDVPVAPYFFSSSPMSFCRARASTVAASLALIARRLRSLVISSTLSDGSEPHRPPQPPFRFWLPALRPTTPDVPPPSEPVTLPMPPRRVPPSNIRPQWQRLGRSLCRRLGLSGGVGRLSPAAAR